VGNSRQRKKRQERRKRQPTGGKSQQRQAVRLRLAERILFPSAEQPLLEVHLAPGTSDDVRATCLAYWAFTEPGVWGRKVAEIGVAHQILKDVKAASYASLPTLVCPGCASPQTVASRSDVQATGFWRPGDYPTSAVITKTLCAECRDAEAIARRERAARAEAEQEERRDRRLANASAWLGRQAEREIAVEEPDVREALTLLAMTEIMHRTGTESVGPMRGLSYTLTGSKTTDTEVLNNLYGKRWVMPTLPATLAEFDFNDDDAVGGVYIAQIPWTVAGWMGVGPKGRAEAAGYMRAALKSEPQALREILLNVEADMVVQYLEGLLVRQYGEQPIPEHRLPDAYDSARRALAGGFTLGQMIAVCWSSAAGSVAWGQRTPGLKPGSVSSAAVTNLDRRIGYAKDRAPVEYQIPKWLELPAIRATALRIVTDLEAAESAMRAFRDLQQRVNTRPTDALELDDDLADLTSEQDHDTVDTSALTFAVVRPDGTLDMRTGSLGDLRHIAGEPYGMTDRVPIDGTKDLIAFLPEYASSEEHPANMAASMMLNLLGAGAGSVSGNVVFCRVGDDNHPRSLDRKLHELVTLAHRLSDVPF
jgi:hypothetical protein